ncbi:hypothetical protein [Novosphingobium terrae]|uniref:hypothetical protein n=1 Tax=Novosphingobium terrae TaxID=2726189 RepID=UPI00198089C5|nr:hypothetical protein [Novosphingobium terrae]
MVGDALHIFETPAGPARKLHQFYAATAQGGSDNLDAGYLADAQVEIAIALGQLDHARQDRCFQPQHVSGARKPDSIMIVTLLTMGDK